MRHGKEPIRPPRPWRARARSPRSTTCRSAPCCCGRSATTSDGVVDFVFDYVNEWAGYAAGMPVSRLLGRRVLEGRWALPRTLFDELVVVLVTGEPLQHRDRLRRRGSRATPSSRAASSSRRRGSATPCSSSTTTSSPRRAAAPRSTTAPCSRRRRTGCRSPIATRTSCTSTRAAGGWSASASTRTSADAEPASSRPRGPASSCAREAFADRPARRDLARRRRAPASRRARDPRLAGHRGAHRARRRGRLLRDDRARHDA